jgi:glycerophosphoryl diester phosphodiesterase
MRPPLVCAHGGDTIRHPPNTVEALRAAVELGADCVEVDVARTKDNRLVAMHKRDLERLAGQPGVQVGAWGLHCAAPRRAAPRRAAPRCAEGAMHQRRAGWQQPGAAAGALTGACARRTRATPRQALCRLRAGSRGGTGAQPGAAGPRRLRQPSPPPLPSPRPAPCSAGT